MILNPYTITNEHLIKVIENHLKEELSVKYLADYFGYSEYYFSRLFKNQMRISVMDYVCKRRLIMASEEIMEGKNIIDVAIKFGWQSHSGFSKAFKKKFGYAPTVIHAMRLSCSFFKEKGGYNYMDIENNRKLKRQTTDFIAPEELYKNLINIINENNTGVDFSVLQKAYVIASNAHNGQFRKSGEPYITHPLCVAIILAEMESDAETIIAGLVHDVIEENTPCTLDTISLEFSKEISQLINDVTQFSKATSSEKNLDYTRLDNRVILIKLADRLHNMRTIEYMDKDRWKEKAKETIEIFSPIAARLGIPMINAELTDLAVKYI